MGLPGRLAILLPRIFKWTPNNRLILGMRLVLQILNFLHHLQVLSALMVIVLYFPQVSHFL